MISREELNEWVSRSLSWTEQLALIEQAELAITLKEKLDEANAFIRLAHAQDAL